MYKRILVPLENGPADAAILEHVTGLAKLLGAQVLLLHVADGWAARNMEQLNLRESQEMKEDRAYLGGCPRSCGRRGSTWMRFWGLGIRRRKSPRRRSARRST